MLSYEDVIEYSPYDELRDVQEDGIKATIEAINNDGFVVLEGECGTGKTLLSLLPITEYIKQSSTKYNQAVVLTSVKQQQKIFEEEIREINSQRKSDDADLVTATTLVGKQDLCPYVNHGAISESDIQYTCESLREGTRNQIRNGGDEITVAQQMQSRSSPTNRETVKRFDTEGTYEYPYEIDAEPDDNYCPFYAGYMEERYQEMDDSGEYEPQDVVPFDLTDEGLIDVYDLVSKSGKAGMCPHSVLGEVIEYVDVAIANYTHVFDEQTRNFTETLIQDDTLVIIDEAHNLVPRVRDILSDKRSVTHSFSRSVKELEELHAIVTNSFGPDYRWNSTEELATDSSFLHSEGDIKEAIELVRNLRTEDFAKISTASGQKKVNNAVSGSSTETLENVLEKYRDVYTQLYTKLIEILGDEIDQLQSDEDEIPLRDPSQLGPDRINQWMQFGGYTELFKNFEAFGKSMTALKSFITSELYEEPTVETNIEDMGSFLQKWASVDGKRYFQLATIEEQTFSPHNSLLQEEWQEEVDVKLELKNCYPRNEIQSMIDNFGGGIFMSATLEPIEMYIKETGLGLFDDRPIITRSYGLRFPKENRKTIAVQSNKFKYNNRKQPLTSLGEPNLDNPTRKEYAQIITSTVNETPGNTLVCMPSYTEAEWAGKVVERQTTLSKDQILIDSQSSLSDTNKLKNEFFEGGKKVLITGIRGTLTEGVDYEGEKLKSAVICGVPLINTQSPFNEAIRTTYDSYFDNGYEFAYTIPAVRKARQAIGRVIRSDTETGVRIFADERYCPTNSEWDSVHKYLPESVTQEITELEVSQVYDSQQEFWNKFDI